MYKGPGYRFESSMCIIVSIIFLIEESEIIGTNYHLPITIIKIILLIYFNNINYIS